MKVDIGFRQTTKPNIEAAFSPKAPEPRLNHPSMGGELIEMPDLFVQEAITTGVVQLIAEDNLVRDYRLYDRSWIFASDGTVQGIRLYIEYIWK